MKSLRFSVCVLLIFGLDFIVGQENDGKIRVLLYNMSVLKKNLTVSGDEALIENLPKIVYDKVVIEDQDIPVIQKDFFEDLDVYELVLTRNKIEKLTPGCFNTLQRTTEISITENLIKTIPKGVFNNLNITTLTLRQNKIEEIASDAFDRMSRLINIDLSWNSISEWNMEWFYLCPRLSRVDLSHNFLTKLPANAFINLAGESFLNDLKLTKSLHFSYNKLSSIGLSAFKSLTEIYSLWLDHNELESFNEKLLEQTKIEDLRLDSNKIRRLSGDWKKILSVPLLSIDSNPFDCDFLKEMLEWSKKNDNKTRLFYSEMNCVVDRINGKMNDLKNRLKKMKEDRLKFEADMGINPEAEAIPDKIESLA